MLVWLAKYFLTTKLFLCLQFLLKNVLQIYDLTAPLNYLVYSLLSNKIKTIIFII